MFVLSTKTPFRLSFALPDTQAVFVSAGRDDMLILGLNGQVYTRGPRINSKLHLVQIPDPDITAVAIASGYDHILVIGSNGRVYICASSSRSLHVMLLPDPATRIVSVSGGAYHTFMIDSLGQLYAYGGNKDGQLGIITSDSIVSNIPLPVPALDVRCGGTHTAVIGVDGKLYTCGNNSSGQLGTGILYGKLGPLSEVKLPDPEVQVVDVATGGAHTVVLGSNGEIYTCGLGKYGQLGLNTVHDYPAFVSTNFRI
jgi:alpha-tubulin suppressor-like RCC1 family protein